MDTVLMVVFFVVFVLPAIFMCGIGTIALLKLIYDFATGNTDEYRNTGDGPDGRPPADW